MTSADFPYQKKPSIQQVSRQSSPRNSEPYIIKVPAGSPRQKKISRQSLASLMDIDDSNRPQPRYSVPFLCKSDLSTLKETTTRAITEKRKSIILDRQKSTQSGSDSDEELQFKKLSVASMPNAASDHGKRISVHSYSRLTSIPDNDVHEYDESVEEGVADEDKTHVNSNNVASEHM